MSSVYERGISIISKPVDKRDDSEINAVLIWFVNLFKRKVAVFGDISNGTLRCFASPKHNLVWNPAFLFEEIVSDIIKNCSFESHQRDDVIIKQGDVGDW